VATSLTLLTFFCSPQFWFFLFSYIYILNFFAVVRESNWHLLLWHKMAPETSNHFVEKPRREEKSDLTVLMLVTILLVPL